MDALHRDMLKMRAEYEALPKRWTDADRASGRAVEARRLYTRMKTAETDEHDYREYMRTLSNLLDVHVSNLRKKLGHEFIRSNAGR